MATRLNPYISFRDNAREALAFYHDVFGGELTMSTFAISRPATILLRPTRSCTAR